ncbi:MAG: hypothetical protein MK008_00185 [Bdellovibrionales bacterium]|nr:hypothetical protein [Bdellovibrionales bacterium]
MKKIIVFILFYSSLASGSDIPSPLKPIAFKKPKLDNTVTRVQRLLPTPDQPVFEKNNENVDTYLKRMFNLKSLSPDEERFFNTAFKNHTNALAYINNLSSESFFLESEKLSDYIETQINCNVLKKDKITEIKDSLLVSLCLYPQYVDEYLKSFKMLKSDNNNLIDHDGDLSFLDIEVGNWRRQMFVINNESANQVIFKHLMLKSALKSMLDDMSLYFENYLSKGSVSTYLYTLPRLRAALRYENKLLSLYEYYNQIICRSNKNNGCSIYKQLIASTLEWELNKHYEEVSNIDHIYSNLKTVSNDKATIQKFEKIFDVSRSFYELHHGNVYSPCFIELISNRLGIDKTSQADCSKISSFKTKYSELTNSAGFLKEDLVNAYNSMYIFENLNITYSLLKDNYFYSGRMQVSQNSDLLNDPKYQSFSNKVLEQIKKITGYLNKVTNKEYLR